MANPLLGSLASAIYSGFNSTMAYNLTHKSVTETEGATGSITESIASYTVRGIVVEYEDRVRFEGIVPDGARRVIMFQPSMTGPAPKLGDRIVPLQGEFANAEYQVSEVAIDPAGAIFDVQVLPWRG